MIEWIGFAIAAWSLPAFSFAFWTFANLAPRAALHHKWYQEKFPDYPKNRNPLIPNFLVSQQLFSQRRDCEYFLTI
jgi:hypothetical protein